MGFYTEKDKRIEKLEAEVKLWQEHSTTSARDAAALEAEVERLRADLRSAKASAAGNSEALELALAEVKRLRAALARVEDLAHDGQDRDAMHAIGRLSTIESKARAALRGGEK